MDYSPLPGQLRELSARTDPNSETAGLLNAAANLLEVYEDRLERREAEIEQLRTKTEQAREIAVKMKDAAGPAWTPPIVDEWAVVSPGVEIDNP